MTHATNANGVTYTLTPHHGGYTLIIHPPAGGGHADSIAGIVPDDILWSSGHLTIGGARDGATYAVAPGATGFIRMEPSLPGTNTLHIGGKAVIETGCHGQSHLAVSVDGGSLSLAAGVTGLHGAQVRLDNDGVFSNGAAKIAALADLTITYGPNGGVFLIDAHHAPFSMPDRMRITGFGGRGDRIELTNLPSHVTYYTVTTAGQSQIIRLYSNATPHRPIGTIKIDGTHFETGSFHEGQNGPLTLAACGDTLIATGTWGCFACFLAGTHILTPMGETPVEDLQDGDLVKTLSGDAAIITSMIRSRLSTRFADQAQVMPVKISRGAFGENLPKRDLYVSPDHAFFFDGFLVPAHLLITGSSIRQIIWQGDITYYHLELEPHDLILAEGAATESFLDTGEQRRLLKAAIDHPVPAQEPKTWEDACAPLLLSGPQLDLIRAGLRERAARLDPSFATGAAA